MEFQQHLQIVQEFLQSISPTLQETIQTVLQLKGGKKGGIYLHGRANCGKSIVVKLMCAFFNFENIGVIPHTSDTDKFMFQDCINKNILVAEELALTDIGADNIKLVLEGHFLASAETKGGGRVLLKRAPVVITANRNIVSCCPWQWEPLKSRLFVINFTTQIPPTHPINFIHYVCKEKLTVLARSLFLDIPEAIKERTSDSFTAYDELVRFLTHEVPD